MPRISLSRVSKAFQDRFLCRKCFLILKDCSEVEVDESSNECVAEITNHQVRQNKVWYELFGDAGPEVEPDFVAFVLLSLFKAFAFQLLRLLKTNAARKTEVESRRLP